MRFSEVFARMFPGRVAMSNGSTADLTAYAEPQGCSILARGVPLRSVETGRKEEIFLVVLEDTAMFMTVLQALPERGCAAHAMVHRCEDPSLTRAQLDAYARSYIEAVTKPRVPVERRRVVALDPAEARFAERVLGERMTNAAAFESGCAPAQGPGTKD